MIKFPNLGYKITDNAFAVLKARYLFRNKQTGEVIEKPCDMFYRVAKKIASCEKKTNQNKWYEEFYDLMASGDFMPNSPTLMNAGRDNNSVLSGCFVVPVEDSIFEGGDSSIFGATRLVARIQQMGGGTGFSLSKLRMKGSLVSSTGHVASGVVSFMGNFNEATESIQQGGMRRGANMCVLSVDHPDIMEFINCKNNLNETNEQIYLKLKRIYDLQDDDPFMKDLKQSLSEKQLTNMNISVGITKEFKEALKVDGYYDLIDPKLNKPIRRARAKYIWNEIITHAWQSGEPAFIDIEEINKHNPTPLLGMILATNPCGEQPLYPFECCNLGSISLPKMLKLNSEGRYEIDYEKFRKRIYQSIRFLDNVIDVQNYPINKIKVATKRTRKVGLGIMGFAEFLIKLDVPYGSQKCLMLIDEFMQFFKEESFNASIELAKEKGVFPAWNKSIYKDQKIKIRNAARTTIAPTGTISGIAGVSFGIEPIYALIYKRRILEGKEFIEVNSIVEEVFKIHGWDFSKASSDLELKNAIPKEFREIFKTSHEVTPEEHIQVQARFQKYIDNAVSKTVNLPNKATVEDVERIFNLALSLGCKGTTIYRDGSRGEQVLDSSDRKETKEFIFRIVKQRPRKLHGLTYKRKVGMCGNLYVTVNEDDGHKIFETFFEAGKTGGCQNSFGQAVGRLASLALRGGLGVLEVVKQLQGITCHQANPQVDKTETYLSCADAFARVIREHFESNPDDLHGYGSGNGSNKLPDFGSSLPESPTCDVCGGAKIREGRCWTCQSCLETKCKSGG